MNDCAILYQVRLDSPQRKRSFMEVLRQMISYSGPCGFDLCVWEVDRKPDEDLRTRCKGGGARYEFHEDTDVRYHRTKWSNRLVKSVDHPIVSTALADVLVAPSQIVQAIGTVKRGEAKYVAAFGDSTDRWGLMRANEKYVEHLENGGRPDAILTDDSLLDFPYKRQLGSYSGMIFLDRVFYLNAGGQHEGIIGWGPDEVERHHRLLMHGSNYIRIPGWAVHMPHPPAYADKVQIEANARVCNEVLAMGPKELKEEVAKWPWRGLV